VSDLDGLNTDFYGFFRRFPVGEFYAENNELVLFLRGFDGPLQGIHYSIMPGLERYPGGYAEIRRTEEDPSTPSAASK
jgi:hypothetical protein